MSTCVQLTTSPKKRQLDARNAPKRCRCRSAVSALMAGRFCRLVTALTTRMTLSWSTRTLCSHAVMSTCNACSEAHCVVLAIAFTARALFLVLSPRTSMCIEQSLITHLHQLCCHQHARECGARRRLHQAHARAVHVARDAPSALTHLWPAFVIAVCAVLKSDGADLGIALQIRQQVGKIRMDRVEQKLAIQRLHEQHLVVQQRLGAEVGVNERRVVFEGHGGVDFGLLHVVLIHLDCAHTVASLRA